MEFKNWHTEKILKFYAEIDLDIKVTMKMLNEYEEGYNPLGAVTYDGMPKGGALSDSTATLAISLSRTDIKEDIETLKRRVKELKKLRTSILKELMTLKLIHKIIVIDFYIKDDKWEQVAERIGYSIRQSKNIRSTALKVLGNKFARNRTISQSKIIAEIIR